MSQTMNMVCYSCGWHFGEQKKCPRCGSDNITLTTKFFNRRMKMPKENKDCPFCGNEPVEREKTRVVYKKFEFVEQTKGKTE